MESLEAQITQEVEQILTVVTRMTGLPSNWNGKLEHLDLLATPLRQRPGAVLALGYQRAGLPRTSFVRAFSAANALLTRRLL
jgi:hypothetical protein